MIRMVCPGCGKKLHAKDELAGGTARCPNCRQPITIPEAPPPSETIPLDDAEPGEHVIPASEDHIATSPRIERLNRESHYLICDKGRLMATWANNGRAGWFAPARVSSPQSERARSCPNRVSSNSAN